MWTQDARKRDPAVQNSSYSAGSIWNEGSFSGHVHIFLDPTTSVFLRVSNYICTINNFVSISFAELPYMGFSN